MYFQRIRYLICLCEFYCFQNPLPADFLFNEQINLIASISLVLQMKFKQSQKNLIILKFKIIIYQKLQSPLKILTNSPMMRNEKQQQLPDYGIASQNKTRKQQKFNDQAEETFKTYTDPIEQSQKNNNYDLKMAGHPIACIMTFAFKALAVVGYFFFGLLFSDVFVFIIVTVLTGIDFWVVKNVTGRLLVGLRWWSDFGEDGKQIWVYESYDREVKLNAVDSAFFWTGQLASSAFWFVFLVLKVLSFSFFWGILVLINFVLSITNLYGFYKCRGQHSKKLKGLKQKYAKQGLLHFASKMI